MAQCLRWLSCSVKGPSLDSQQPHDNSQLSVTIVTGDLMLSSGRGRHCMHVVCSQYRQNSNMHNIKQKTIKDINCECLVFIRYIFQVLKLLLHFKTGRIYLHFKLREKHIVVMSEEIKKESWATLGIGCKMTDGWAIDLQNPLHMVLYLDLCTWQ